LGNGDGTFQPAVNYPVGTNPVSIALGDFIGTGNIDLAVADIGFNSITILKGNGNGTFTTSPGFGVGIGPISVAAADFTGNGKLDLVVASGGSAFLSVLLNNTQ
jgi:hypothetical protein